MSVQSKYVAVLLSVNVLLLWFLGGYLWWGQKQLHTLLARQPLPGVESAPSVTSASLSASLQAAVVRIDQLEASVAAQAAATPSAQSLVTPSKQTGSALATYANAGAKEYFVHLGSGSTRNLDWTDLDTTTISLDPKQYGAATTATFEATVSIVSGEVYARLKNKSSGAILAVTEVVHNTSTPSRKVSGNFTLHPGANEYVVQLRSSNGELAQLGEARIKIALQ